MASILPFMAVLTNPELVQTNAVLNTAFTISRHIGIYTPEQFLFALSGCWSFFYWSPRWPSRRSRPTRKPALR